MSKFTRLLREYAEPIQMLAGADESIPSPPIERKELDEQRLLADLERTRRSYRFWSTLWLIVAIVIVLAELVIAFTRRAATPAADGVAGAAVLGLLTLAANQIKGRAQVELLIALAQMMDRTALQTIVAVLAQSLK